MRLTGVIYQNIRLHSADCEPFGHAHKLAAVLHIRSHCHYLGSKRHTAPGHIIRRFVRIHIMNNNIHSY
ncbi:hypothetical protein D3C81_1861710 [compost metagenome]